MKYKTNLFKAMLMSIALHFILAIVLIFIFPKIFPAPTVPAVQVIEWVDVDLSDEVTAIDKPVITAPLENDSADEFHFAPIELPPLEIPKVEPLTQPKIEVVKPPEPPPPVQPKIETPPKVDAEKISDSDEESAENQQWVSVPTLILAVYPEENFGYTGEIMIMATIGKDGKVKNAELVFPTGNSDVDSAALDAAKKWTFKPALDKDGKPTECSYSIIMNFKKIFGED